MKKPLLLLTMLPGIVALTFFSTIAADTVKTGFSDFIPIEQSAKQSQWNADAPWKIPQGYSQHVVSDESALNIYGAGRNDWHDMNTVNENGPQTGRFLYRTHELRYPRNLPQGGAISVVDLKTGKSRILAVDPDYDALDGIRWTPWGTLLFAEEKTGGRLFEIELNADLVSVKKIHDRPAVGRLAHEGIEIDDGGNLYLVDEHRGNSTGCDSVKPCGGGIYKFIPDTSGDLSAGSLYALKVTGDDGTGQGEWVGPIDPMDARMTGTQAGGQSYQRPEDLEIIDGILYAAITEGPRDEFGEEIYESRVISIDLKTLQVSNFVKPGLNVPREIGVPADKDHQSGFDGADNLAEAPNGDLVIIEDNTPSDIWFASTDNVSEFGASQSVRLFASLSDPEAEGSGIYFSPFDPYTLYVNIQHAAAFDGDGTWAIIRKGGKGWKSKHERDDD